MNQLVDDFAENSIIEFKERLARWAQNCYRKRDIPGIMAVLEKLERKARSIDDLTAQGQLASTIAHVITLAAEAHLDDLAFEPCFALCQDVYDLLKRSAQQFKQRGEKPPKNSMAWCGLLLVLADAKWKYRDDTSELVMPTSEMITRYLGINARVCSLTKKSRIADKAAEDRYRHLLWCGVMLLKQAMRFEPSQIKVIEQAMNSVHPGILADRSESYYWDVQIAREVFTGEAVSNSLRYLYEMRYQCIRWRFGSAYELMAYKQAAAKEMEYLLDRRRSLAIAC